MCASFKHSLSLSFTALRGLRLVVQSVIHAVTGNHYVFMNMCVISSSQILSVYSSSYQLLCSSLHLLGSPYLEIIVQPILEHWAQVSPPVNLRL